MAKFSVMSLEEARRAAMPPRRALQEQYRAYVRQLDPDTAGQIEMGEGDRSITERARLKAAAKAEGVILEIRKRGNTIVFWQTPEPPKLPVGNGRRRTRREQASTSR